MDKLKKMEKMKMKNRKNGKRIVLHYSVDVAKSNKSNGWF